MAIHRIQGPDGRIHRIEAPDNATPQEIEAFAASVIPAGPENPEGNVSSAGEAALVNFNRNLPFGTDIVAGIGAGIANLMGTPVSFEEAKASTMADVEKAKKEYPDASLYGGISGALASGFAVPAKALQGASVAGRAAKGAMAGGLLGFGYGAQEGDNLSERIGEGAQASVPAAAFGAGGSVAGDAVRAGWDAYIRPALAGAGQRIGPLTQKAMQAVSRRSQSVRAGGNNPAPTGAGAGDDYLAAIQRPLQQNVDSSLTPSSIPLTKAQATQDPRLQALEYGAQAGAYGDDAQRLALEARELQSDAAKSAVGQLAGDADEFAAAGDLGKALREGYAAARQKTREAYRAVGQMQEDAPLRYGAEYVKGSVLPAIKDWARKGGDGLGFDLAAPNMTNAKRLYGQAMAFEKIKGVNTLNYARMEQWRSRVSQALGDAKAALPPGVRANSETAFLSGMLERYDDAIKALPREAIKSGDDALIEAMEKARFTRADQGRKFERNKIVADILDKDAISNEALANMFFGKGRTFKGDPAITLKAITNAVPDKADEVTQAFKSGVYSKILRNSLDASELKGGGGTEEMVSFNKLASNLKELVNSNPTLFKALHTPEEQEFIKAVMQDAKKIASVKPGSKNYSNSAYTIMNWVRQISPLAERGGLPFTGSIGSGLKSVGDSGAMLDIEKSLAPVFKGTADELAGSPFNFTRRFGLRLSDSDLSRLALGGAIAGDRLPEEPLITVRPGDKN